MLSRVVRVFIPLLVLSLAVSVGPVLPAAITAASPDDLVDSLLRYGRLGQAASAEPEAPLSRRYVGGRLIGVHDLGKRGFNADIWVHEEHAYIGQWGIGNQSRPDLCPPAPKGGVKVLNVSDPTQPRVVATLQNPAKTTAEDFVVFTAESGPLQGRDIAAVGIQACFSTDISIFRGLQLFDVTDPSNPEEIGRLSSGFSARGVHELSVVQRRDGQILALEAVPFSEISDATRRGDLRIADITDPRAPEEIVDWGIKKNLGEPTGPNTGQGHFNARFAHSTTGNRAGTRAIVSYWDFGQVMLNIADPRAPKFRGRTTYAPEEDGDAHSAWLSEDERYLLTADEDFNPEETQGIEKGWGFLRIFDIGGRDPVEVAQFKTRHSRHAGNRARGNFSIHNPTARDGRLYLSWYSDGVRALDFSNPLRPREIASFVPPGVPDPLGYWPAHTLVWGIFPARVSGRVYLFASDINAGLYIFRVTAP